MEILMKLKCATSMPGSTASLSTVKIIDHHQQLKQQQNPQRHYAMSAAAAATTKTTIIQEILPAAAECLDYGSRTTTLDCCGNMLSTRPTPTGIVGVAAVPSECTKLCYDSTTGYCVGGMDGACAAPPSCCNANVSLTMCSATAPPPLAPAYSAPAHYAASPANATHDDSYEYEEPEENFVSIDDAKIKGFLMSIGKQNKSQQSFDIEQYRADAKKLRLERHGDMDGLAMARTENALTNRKGGPVIYEIIELDDEQEQERLRSLKHQAVQNAKEKECLQAGSNTAIPHHSQPQSKHFRQSPDISLIPKVSEGPATKTNESAQRIVAEIELLDSSDEEHEVAADNYDDEDDFPLAAAAVSCELDCDDDDEATDLSVGGNVNNENLLTPSLAKTPSVGDDDTCMFSLTEPTLDEYINENEEGVVLQWEDLSEGSRNREKDSTHECQLCGKVVQSSYNLRRHMMIHTGERPFGCDLCVRRFREFSDLKKHRRRHVNERAFICMVCHLNKPTANDPTRCYACEFKQIPPKFFSDQARAAAAAASSAADRIEDMPTPPALLKRPSPPRSAVTLQRISIPAATKITKIALTPPPLKRAATPPLPPLTPISSATTLSTNSDAWLNQLTIMQRAQNSLDSSDNANNALSQSTVATNAAGRKEFACPLCDRAFGTRHNLKRHFMIHTGEKPFSCTQCRKPFREYSTLKKHMVTHLRERWYKCARCPRSFRDYIDYMEHKKLHADEDDGTDIEPSALRPNSNTGTNMSSATNSSNNSLTNSPQKRDKGEFMKAIASGVYTTASTTPYEISDDSNEEDSCADDWLECCECNERFTDIDVYSEHLKQHDRQGQVYECYVCKQQLESRDMLEEHIGICKEKHGLLANDGERVNAVAEDVDDNENNCDDRRRIETKVDLIDGSDDGEQDEDDDVVCTNDVE